MCPAGTSKNMARTKLKPGELLPLDQLIADAAARSPGAPVADLARSLLGQWSTVHVRSRVDYLDAVGIIHVERTGGRVYIHPAIPGDV